jgi:hypothetical protein
MRKCICGERIEPDENYGPASQHLFKWYPHGRAFGSPGTRRKFYLCSRHTNELADYLEAVSENIPVIVMRETQDAFES